MPAIVTALTEGNIITITSTDTNYGITTTTKVVRTKKQCYSNITGTGTAQVFSIVDHKGATIFTKTFASGVQSEVTHSINAKVTFADIWAEFNTWNGGEGVAALQFERVYVAQITQTGTSAPTFTVIKNTLQGPITFGAPSSAGVYTHTIGGIWNKAKASFNCGGTLVGNTLVSLAVNSDLLTLSTTVSNTNTPTNGLLTAIPIEIRVQH